MEKRRVAIQVAIDTIEEAEALRIASMIGDACRGGVLPPDSVIIEAGTPLIKSRGIGVLSKLKVAAPGVPLLADMKTADVGRLEASLAYAHGADYTTVLAAAPLSTLRSALEAALEAGKGVAVDLLGMRPQEAAVRLEEVLGVVRASGIDPGMVIVSFHRGIDEGAASPSFFRELAALVNEVRSKLPGVKVSIAGGLTPELKRAIEPYFRPDIYVVGRYITSSPSVEKVLEFLQ